MGKSNHFWYGRPVLVTGITGFVGANLAGALVRKGARVVGIYRDDVAGSALEVLGLKERVTLVHGDLRDIQIIERTLNEYSIEIVYHLAAQAIVGVANRSPIATFQSNIEGTWNLLEACRHQQGIEAIVVASSDKAYGSHKKLPYDETFPLQPEFPYDTSKACADLIARSYFKTYGLPIVITRFANIYGPGDMNFSRIIPDTIQNILKGEAPIIRSDGTPERDYLYVEDVAGLYLLLAENIEKAKGEVFNAGHKKPYSVKFVVDALLKIGGKKKLKPVIEGKGKLHGEIDRQWMDGAKVKKILGWEPKVSLGAGLKKTFAWYKAWLKP